MIHFLPAIAPRGEQLHFSKTYAEGYPFPHGHFDKGFDPDQLRAVVREVDGLPEGLWDHNDMPLQTHKFWLSNHLAMRPALRELLFWFNGSTFLNFLTDLTGIRDLVPDNTFYGGGVHRTEPGGKLGIHTDFNIHPHLRLHRRLNALLFLNESWDDEWGGHLEMWGPEGGTKKLECKRSISPVFNRLVVFDITNKSYHGMVEPLVCPPGVCRLSLALYYYTVFHPGHDAEAPRMARWFHKNPAGEYREDQYSQ